MFSFENFIAKRYFFSRRKIGFISVITYFATIGIMLGVMVLNIVLSVMNGFEDIVKEKIVGAISHVQVRAFHNKGFEQFDSIANLVRKMDGVNAAAPMIVEKAVISSDNHLEALVLNGIDTSTIEEVIDIHKYIFGGELELGMRYQAASNDSLPGIVLGYDLADRLRVMVGETVIIGGFKDVKLTGNFRMPKLLKCVVTGVFKSGFYDYDAAFGFVSLPTAQKLFKIPKKANQIDVRLKNMYHAKRISEQISDELKYPFYASNWIEQNQNLFTWIKLEKKMMFIILNLIILVAVFNIISALIMLVLHKTKEIGILRAMGATQKNIRNIFIFDGLTAGILGTFLGTVLSIIILILQQKFNIITIPADLYTIDSLPVKIVPLDFLIVAGSALILSFLATLYPSYKAAHLKTVEALVYE